MKLTAPELRALAASTGILLDASRCTSEIVAKLLAELPQIVAFAGQTPYQFETHNPVLMLLEALSTASDPDAQEAGLRSLIRLTETSHPLNILAQFRLPRINHPEVVAAHRRRLPDLPNHYRADTLEILIEIQGAQCLDVLLAVREDPYLGKLVLPYLARWAPLAAVELAHRHFLAFEYTLRLAAVHAFGIIDQPGSLAPLFAATLDTNRRVRAAALEALGGLKNPCAKRCIEALYAPEETRSLVQLLVARTPGGELERLHQYLTVACQRSPRRHRRPIYRALHETLLASRQALIWLLRNRRTTAQQ